MNIFNLIEKMFKVPAVKTNDAPNFQYDLLDRRLTYHSAVEKTNTSHIRKSLSLKGHRKRLKQKKQCIK